MRGFPRHPSGRGLLVAVKRLHRRFNVECPRFARSHARLSRDFAASPHRAFIFAGRRKRAPNGILAADLVHAKKFGKSAIATRSGDVSVGLAPGENDSIAVPSTSRFLARSGT
jgi:hypothetical protein